MALRDDIKNLNAHYKNLGPQFIHNATLFDIFEGNLLQYVLEDLQKQLSENSYETVKHRVPPINVLRKVIDKQSKIYVKAPSRTIVKGKEKDNKNLTEFTNKLELNTKMQDSNEIFNLAKSVALEPFLDEGVPSIRILPPDKFFVYSVNKVNPLKPTHFVKCMGKQKVGSTDREIFHAYTDTEFLIYDDHNEERTEMMAEYDNDGTNAYKKIPFVYINRSKHLLTPKIDTDTLQMTKLVPILLADCNFCAMFQSFSIIYGIDVNDENLKMAPNAFWRFKSEEGDKKPQIGVIKPEADTDKVLNLIRAEISIWFQTKNIKPGSIGTLTVDTAASGISKMIDESDTSEDRATQTPIFAKAEENLLSLIVNHMHPVWSLEKDYAHRGMKFSPNLEFKSIFPEQKPITDSSKVIDDEIKKLDNGLTTTELAIKAIEPDLTDDQIKELVQKILEENRKKSEEGEEEASPKDEDLKDEVA